MRGAAVTGRGVDQPMPPKEGCARSKSLHALRLRREQKKKENKTLAVSRQFRNTALHWRVAPVILRRTGVRIGHNMMEAFKVCTRCVGISDTISVVARFLRGPLCSPRGGGVRQLHAQHQSWKIHRKRRKKKRLVRDGRAYRPQNPTPPPQIRLSNCRLPLGLTDTALSVIAPRHDHAVLAQARDLIRLLLRHPANCGCRFASRRRGNTSKAQGQLGSTSPASQQRSRSKERGGGYTAQLVSRGVEPLV